MPTPDLNALLATRVRQWRQCMGLTLEDAAAQIGCSSFVLSTLETGKKSPTLDTLSKLCGAMGVRAEELLRSESAPSAPEEYRAVIVQTLELTNAVQRNLKTAYDVYRKGEK